MAPPSKVLMVAEKPSIALSIASVLSRGQMTTRRGSTEVHEFDGIFMEFSAHYKVTSVIGHVFSVDFPGSYQDWTATDPIDLFQAPIRRTETNPKAHICRHLSQEARSCSHLVLWLDCDREGENICFEVIECAGFYTNDARRRVYRARFSSVTEKDILKAMDNLVEPNKDEALAVDARQEIDLKVGVAFTRFQTSYFQGKYGNLDSRVISYGPCQTPTLGFCVQRYLQITTFKPEKFWSLRPHILKNGYELQLEWERSKLFDLDAAMMFQKLVIGDGIVKVSGISEKQESKGRPSGLNTVNLLKVASSALGFGPQMAMQLAERLYTQGFISYPRTESTAYPSSFDFKGALRAQTDNPIWGDYVRGLLAEDFCKPRLGTDAGDHPPITPMRSATEDILGKDAWRLYQYVCQHFMGTVSPDCKYIRTKVEFSIGGESFYCTGQRVTFPGFTSIMPWLAVNEKNLPQFAKGEKIEVSKVELHEGNTVPPEYLSESELISLMEKNGIGTDASIPVHINNICERNYVQVQAGRKLVPTPLGITLIRGYQCIDPDLCLPDIRSFIEHQITLVAKGQADHSSVVHHVLNQFKQKYSYFVKQIESMDALFEAQFSPLVDSGRVLSKCGKCVRYMKYISSQPPRLYCGTCEEVYYLPQKGAVKLYKELTCPLDNFELLILSMPGPEGKSFPLCPYCYNSPPFEGVERLYGATKTSSFGKLGKGAGMPCFLCPHPTCRHSLISQGVCACPECSGTLVLDPVSAPKWRLYCNTCNCLVFLPEGAHRIATTQDRCSDCDSTILEVDFNKKTTPLENGATLHTGCILCDELLHSLVELKHGRSFSKRMGMRRRGRGRGMGRGGSRGKFRGSGKMVDPKMSFRDF
ncbi:DNA topoisomerase 3-beta isoform X1 [Carica papaya]|uniref:DNA topoisomerase 3-beta isoform X1 n=2 Tax=Carica papaya TaxID=3649 RepID=UPI000B8C9475|nr:DNA topoisomerase 3-beta isoform X1 [Carica papaya]XP_021888953.1 DNA topoisomerase 3-beta isoform X1 [Carica papaya]